MGDFTKPDKFFVTVDAVVFTILNKHLKILLIQRKYDPFKGKFALPGGFVKLSENLEAAVQRELEEETGVRNIYFKKLEPFGDVNRDPRGRVITVPFLALIDGESVKLHASTDAELAKWHDADSLPPLAFDHKQIIARALEILRRKIEEGDIAFQIMPEKFTLSELQMAYEVILGKDLDKRNFRKKMHELDILKSAREMRMEGAHRPAELYSFRKR